MDVVPGLVMHVPFQCRDRCKTAKGSFRWVMGSERQGGWEGRCLGEGYQEGLSEVVGRVVQQKAE